VIELPAIPLKVRRALVWVGYPAFAVVVAILTMYVTLPRDRIKDRLEQQLSSDPMSGQPLALGLDTTIEDVSLTLFSGLGIRGDNLLLRTRPTAPDAKPARISIDDATVHVGLFGLIFNRPTYTFKIHGFKGIASGAVDLSVDESALNLAIGGVDLGSAPPGLIGLPLEGTLSMTLDAKAPKNLAGNAEGSLNLTIEDAAIGDGKAKLTVPGDPFLSQGVTFPRIRLGRIAGQAVMEKGKAKLDGFVVHSGDVDLTLEGYIELRDPISMSQVHAFLKFKPSEALVKREPTIDLMNNALGAMAKRPDGYIGFQLTGPLGAVFVMPSKDPPPGVTVRAMAAGTVSAAPPAGASPAPTMLPPPPAPPPHVVANPEPEEAPQPAPQPPLPPPPPPSATPQPTSVPPPAAARANLGRALDELTATGKHGEDPSTPPPPPPNPEGGPVVPKVE